MERWRDIYDFWFGVPGTAEHGTAREMWFRSDPEVDAEIAARFAADYERAVAGGYDGWTGARGSAMALVILLDQFPRNIFRGDPRAFAADHMARDVAHRIVSGPLHEELMTVEKVFAYLPFEHSEDLADQERCVALFEALEEHEGRQEWIDYAVEHRDLIATFGRFPHRNPILGRESTEAERAWLAASDRRFGTAPEPDDAA